MPTGSSSLRSVSAQGAIPGDGLEQSFPPSEGGNEHPPGFELDSAIEQISRWLPTQRPLKDFIHHNPLHALQNRPFHEAIAIASRLYGARSYWPLSEYQARYRGGRIHDFALHQAVIRVEPDSEKRESLYLSLFMDDPEAHYPPPSLALQGLRQAWLTHLELNLDALVHPLLFRLIGHFLDQGISRWSIARPEESLWPCLQRLVHGSFVPLFPFTDPEARELVRLSADEAMAAALSRIVGDETRYGLYLLEMSLAHPGWSGMVRVVEKRPESLLTVRQVSLKAFMAVELVMQLALLNQRRGSRFPALAETPGIDRVPSFAEALDNPEIPRRLRVWQEAMEGSLHTELLQALTTQHRPPVQARVIAQALFCLDDRECSLRRHLEEINPAIETFGAAGFFGIDFLYQGRDERYPVAQCPAAMKPRHLVVESGQGKPPPRALSPLAVPREGAARSRLMRHWLFTQTVGLGYAARLALAVFRPGDRLAGSRKLGEVEAPTRLHLVRQSEQSGSDGLLLGFSPEEMTDRLEVLFRNIGLTRDFAPVVVVVAHGSSSTNNPHFAAYDCGACAGKPGAPNARAFAQMANDPEVRRLLAQRGIELSPTTRFVAALHNTSRDEITYLDAADWPEPRPAEWVAFQQAMQQALGRNAHERCRWFELAPRRGGEVAALAHVRTRAASLFEPRPELNHANNLYCIVGRRALTRQLFLDRRAFLHSYDPDADSDGVILARILSQVIPVCGGINLEYLFSRIDNSIYGAGTKLPHNVIGLLGVANGLEGDLRTGLPSQMIEGHEPARLLIAVEQNTTRLDRAIAHLDPSLCEWLDHEWIRLAAVDPETREPHWYERGEWKPCRWPVAFQTPSAPRSREVYAGKSGTLAVHHLAGEAI